MTVPEPGLGAAERAVLAALRGLRFGALEIVVHDGRVVRIERTEKLRLEDDRDPRSPGTEEQEPSRPRPERRSPPHARSGGPT